MLLPTHDGYHKLHPASLINCTRSLHEQKKGCTMACIQKQLQCPYNAKAAVFLCSVVLAADVLVFHSCCIEFYVNQKPLILKLQYRLLRPPGPKILHLVHVTSDLALHTSHNTLQTSHLATQTSHPHTSQLRTHSSQHTLKPPLRNTYIRPKQTGWLACWLTGWLGG